MARAARLSGADLDEDEFEEIEELILEKQTHPDDMVRQLLIQLNFDGSNPFGTMKICSRQR